MLLRTPDTPFPTARTGTASPVLCWSVSPKVRQRCARRRRCLRAACLIRVAGQIGRTTRPLARPPRC